MNALPQILRQSNTSTVHHRQGPFYNLKLNGFYRRTDVNSTDRHSSLRKSKLNVNRYSIERSQLQSRKANYSTISYDFRNDSQFYGTKGKKDQIQSYQILIAERQKEANIVGNKIAAYRGTKQFFQDQFDKIKTSFNQQLVSFQTQFKQQIINLRQLLSNLRKQTQLQIKSFKQDIKIQNEDLIVYCEQLKMIDNNFKKVKQTLQDN